MKHTTHYDSAERWVKNAARTAYKNMTYDNAIKALMLATAGANVASAAGTVMGGLATGRAAQVAGGVASGLAAASTVAPQVRPYAQAAASVSNVTRAQVARNNR